jgi:adenylate kinase
MKIRVILGAPCSGKGTQCHLLKNLFSHISAGEILRRKYPKGTEIRKTLDEGNLVSVDLMNDLIKEEIQTRSEDLIIDGYPRNIDQATFISKLPIHSVLFLNVSNQTALTRMYDREICENCEKTYPGHFLCCSPTVKRLDDNLSSFKRRMDVFYKDIFQILTIMSVPIYFIDAEKSIAEVNEQIKKFL